MGSRELTVEKSVKRGDAARSCALALARVQLPTGDAARIYARRGAVRSVRASSRSSCRSLARIVIVEGLDPLQEVGDLLVGVTIVARAGRRQGSRSANRRSVLGAFAAREPAKSEANAAWSMAAVADGRLRPHVAVTLPFARAGEALMRPSGARCSGRSCSCREAAA